MMTTESHRTKRLVLCFDGTGNSYSGTTADTNVVKLYRMLDKHSPDQFHYYQPGIGTYTVNATTTNLNPFEKFGQNVKKTLDQAVGLMFDAHVMAGYKFIMRYYSRGDKIFIFGFSRGAFTARFLARMICAIGVLSKGNEEMVGFAYKRYQDSISRAGRFKGKSVAEIRRDLEGFKATFCRNQVVPYFLGLFDTVNSVGVFKLPEVHKITEDEHQYDSIARTATYVRHAVAIDERRCKFRPALLCPGATRTEHQTESHTSNQGTQRKKPAIASSTPAKIREMFFAGNHGDIGGGWPAKGKKKSDQAEDPVQLSDIALNWMLEELDAINVIAAREEDKIAFNDRKAKFQWFYSRKMKEAATSKLHDSIKFHGGEGIGHWKSAVLWKFVEILPVARLELFEPTWEKIRWPPNYGGTRDIPRGAEIHATVQIRIKHHGTGYRPKNQGLEHLSS